MINIHDEAGEIVDANPVMAAELGYDREEIVEMDVWEIDTDMDPAEAIDVWQSLEMGETHRLETTFRRADGTTFPVEVQIRRVDVQGEDRFLASRDISERKAYERRIERENERLDEFASIVSHDLRNPLNVLSGYLRLARETGNESYFERCDTALDEMERLIADVLTLARQGDAVGSVDPRLPRRTGDPARDRRVRLDRRRRRWRWSRRRRRRRRFGRGRRRDQGRRARGPRPAQTPAPESLPERGRTRRGPRRRRRPFGRVLSPPTTVPEYLKTGAMRCSKAVTRPPSREPGSGSPSSSASRRPTAGR